VSYRRVYEKLQKLPAEQRKLQRGTYMDKDGCFCALGAICPTTVETQGADILSGPSGIGDYFVREPKVRRQIHALGMSLVEAIELQRFNDRCKASSPEHRYYLVTDWLWERVQVETLAAGFAKRAAARQPVEVVA
jgi:hypothetical protein